MTFRLVDPSFLLGKSFNYVKFSRRLVFTGCGIKESREVGNRRGPKSLILTINICFVEVCQIKVKYSDIYVQEPPGGDEV